MKQKCDKAFPTTTHKFIASMHHSKKLLRVYTQNIDSLEMKVPTESEVSDCYHTEKVFQMHGNLEKLYCRLCHNQVMFEEKHIERFMEGTFEICKKCEYLEKTSTKRTKNVGFLRPTVVLYGDSSIYAENIRATLRNKLENDLKKLDCLIVIGKMGKYY